ncbi:hypothetical protein PTNB73_00482 [Pyrenophora teres f. teres]|uniref:Uncharacterized protein n=1 Tax=Pyrenophora teres f. teres TaxID=97479 RepID=A0A6S6VD42_9PLEO|nr:hypothetical protein PTNB73_00482 [Pyrenophora teres f. teres]CAE7010243.1 hypothetical protein PTTW11_01980 [Pyrenophora teres f. teres]
MKPPTDDEKTRITSAFLSGQALERLTRYDHYFNYYEQCFAGLPDNSFFQNDRPASSTHEGVVSSFDRLIGNVEQTEANFRDTFDQGVSNTTRTHAIRALLYTSLMVYNYEYNFPAHHVRDFVPQSWGQHQPFDEFVKGYFPPLDQSPEVRKEARSALEQRRRLTARRLEERHKVRLRTTDNLAEHLVFDKDRRVLYIFRHIGFLKAHLERPIRRDHGVDIGFADSLRKGTLPPQLLLEIMNSIQYLLFPLEDRSFELARKFIDKYDFDPELGNFQAYTHGVSGNFEYKYLAGRVATLLEVANSPMPATSRFTVWVEENTSERNALTVAILGLFLSVLLGFLGLIAGIISAIYTIKQYNVAVQALHTPPNLSQRYQ